MTTELQHRPHVQEIAVETIWRDHFRLACDPFALTPDPEFLYLGDEHAEALAGIKLGLLEKRGLIVLTGDIGAGKTTIVYSILSALDEEMETAYVSNTSLSFEEILASALKDFGEPCSRRTPLESLETLNDFLRRSANDGQTVVLVVDEAQNLSDEAFERLRLLLNFESYKAKLLQIVLVGQPELRDKLNKSGLRQIADRIAVHCDLKPLRRRDVPNYVNHRLRTAGGTSGTFTRGALAEIVRRSRGRPRRINILCHNAMLFAYGRKQLRVRRSMIRAAARDVDARPRRSLRWVAATALLLVLASAGVFSVAKLTGNWPLARSFMNGTDLAARPPAHDSDGARTRTASPGDSITSLMLEVYGSNEQALLRRVLAANPEIKNPDDVLPGTILVFPPREVRSDE